MTDRVLRLRLPNGALPCRGGLDARRLGTPGRIRGDLGGVPVAHIRSLLSSAIADLVVISWRMFTPNALSQSMSIGRGSLGKSRKAAANVQASMVCSDYMNCTEQAGFNHLIFSVHAHDLQIAEPRYVIDAS